MKKYLILGVVFLGLVLSNPMVTFTASEDIRVLINNKQVQFDVPPQIQSGRTLVPLRAIFEALGATVEWDAKTSMITGKKGTTTIKLKLNTRSASVNNENVTLDVPAVSVNGRTLVPTRFIAESMGMNVTWDSGSRSVNIKPLVNPSAITIKPTMITTPQSGLEKLIPKYIKASNMSDRWYDGSTNTGYSTKGARIKETFVEFTQPFDIKELYMDTESATYNFEFIDSKNNSYKLVFPTVEASKLQKANYWISSYRQHRTKLDLKDIIKVKMTVGDLFKTDESTILPSQITDFTAEIEINGTK
jgi:hypothetical protein